MAPSTGYVPATAQTDPLPPIVERYSGAGQPGATVAHVDALQAARALVLAGVRADLIYIDPPFAAARDFIYSPRHLPEAHGRAFERVAFADRWPDGLEGYLAFMEPVLRALFDLLDDEGSLLLHCDHRASPYLAMLCDRIFGLGDRGRSPREPGFRNEVIWSYGLGGSSPRCYPKKHDTILWYTRGRSWFFEPPLVPATSIRMRGQLKKAPDVLAIPTINNMAAERTGYPTQKPIALLDLLVRAHSRPGDRVVDLFCGSGTTAIAAARAGRRPWVSDLGVDAVAVTRARLLRDGLALELRGAAPTASEWPIRRTEDGWRVEMNDDAPLVFLSAGSWADECLEATSRWDAEGGSCSAPGSTVSIEPFGGSLEIRGPATGFSVRDAAGRGALGPLTP